MKKLNDLLKGIDILSVQGPDNPAIEGIAFDSRKVAPNFMFIAVKGTTTDGHNYISQAVNSGAVAIVYDDNSANWPATASSILVKNSARALGLISSSFYNNPSSKMKLVGITGTNGKTTTITQLHRLFNLSGLKSGSFTTICNYIGERPVEATHTTPDPVRLNLLLNEMAGEGCLYCFMEVSSHALAQERVAGLNYAGAIFSNITHDHLDYHKTFDDYIKAKKLFFDNLDRDSFALVNADDRNSRIMTQNTKARVVTYGVRTMADFKARIIESHVDGMLLEIDGSQIWSRLIGAFNAYNLLAVYGTARLLGLEKEQVLGTLSSLETVNGRFQNISSETGVTAIIDYAHTPDALENVLGTIRQVRSKESRIITVAGAGGDRDRTKRPEMGAIAASMSDIFIITSDNPRSEDPDRIILDIKEGIKDTDIKKVLSVADRKEAIKTACMMARSGDIILVAGKGHETYQEIKGVKHHFNDFEVVKEIFKQ